MIAVPKVFLLIKLKYDIIQINRVEALLEKFGDKFIKRIFTIDEIVASKTIGTNNNIGRASYFAKRFAAKEAFAKALGTGFRHGLRFKNIGIVNNKFGKPYIIATGKAIELLSTLSPKDIKKNIHLTMSDDYPIAIATVIISER